MGLIRCRCWSVVVFVPCFYSMIGLLILFQYSTCEDMPGSEVFDSFNSMVKSGQEALENFVGKGNNGEEKPGFPDPFAPPGGGGGAGTPKGKQDKKAPKKQSTPTSSPKAKQSKDKKEQKKKKEEKSKNDADGKIYESEIASQIEAEMKSREEPTTPKPEPEPQPQNNPDNNMEQKNEETLSNGGNNAPAKVGDEVKETKLPPTTPTPETQNTETNKVNAEQTTENNTSAVGPEIEDISEAGLTTPSPEKQDKDAKIYDKAMSQALGKETEKLEESAKDMGAKPEEADAKGVVKKDDPGKSYDNGSEDASTTTTTTTTSAPLPSGDEDVDRGAKILEQMQKGGGFAI